MQSNEMTLKATQFGNDFLLSHEVEKVSDLPEWADPGTYIFVKEKGWLYIFADGKWTEFTPKGPNSAGYAAYQQLQLRRAKTRRIPEEEERLQEQMMIAKHEPTYAKKKEPEVIGQRVYTDPYWRDVPVIFGVFGIEVVIGTVDIDKSKNPEPKVMARDHEKEEDRIKVNVSNFALFLDEKYCRIMETPSTDVVVYEDEWYRVKKSICSLQVDRKRLVFWKPMLFATWTRNKYEEIVSPMHISKYEMKDTDIPSMTDLVTKMIDHMNDTLAKRVEAKEKAEREALEAKEAKKIYYDMLGI